MQNAHKKPILGGVIYVEKCLVIRGIITTFVATYVVCTYI